MKKLHEVLSALFHPSVVTFIVFSITVTFLHLEYYSLLIITIFYSIIPFLIVFFMVKAKKVTDIYVSRKEERFIPISLSIFSYIIGLILVKEDVLFKILLIYIINTIIILLITLKFKISVHVSTTVGGITLLVFILGIYYIPLYLFGVLISISRYKLKAHTFSQIISAWFLAPLSYIELYFMFHTLFYVRT
ncbi:hypothetical protein SJAV_21090 [Sulfurisphaera javensis]|uniref:Uncharacterized protein n=1 Tax=Sulfurisphaera javensis TaxID=2049879 RepID=A0AAT9GTN2_9CREN